MTFIVRDSGSRYWVLNFELNSAIFCQCVRYHWQFHTVWFEKLSKVTNLIVHGHWWQRWSLVTKRPSSTDMNQKETSWNQALILTLLLLARPWSHPQMEVKCSAVHVQGNASLKSEMGVFVYLTYDWWCLAQNNSQKV
jgi:hypothetical protein